MAATPPRRLTDVQLRRELADISQRRRGRSLIEVVTAPGHGAELRRWRALERELDRRVVLQKGNTPRRRPHTSGQELG